MIATWIAERREFLEALPHDPTGHSTPPLEDIVAVVTPFSAQASLIRHELGERGIDRVTVGTVHALQGAERDLVLFSSVYTRDDTFEPRPTVKQLCDPDALSVERRGRHAIFIGGV